MTNLDIQITWDDDGEHTLYLDNDNDTPVVYACIAGTIPAAVWTGNHQRLFPVPYDVTPEETTRWVRAHESDILGIADDVTTYRLGLDFIDDITFGDEVQS